MLSYERTFFLKFRRAVAVIGTPWSGQLVKCRWCILRVSPCKGKFKLDYIHAVCVKITLEQESPNTGNHKRRTTHSVTWPRGGGTPVLAGGGVPQSSPGSYPCPRLGQDRWQDWATPSPVVDRQSETLPSRIFRNASGKNWHDSRIYSYKNRQI